MKKQPFMEAMRHVYEIVYQGKISVPDDFKPGKSDDEIIRDILEKIISRDSQVLNSYPIKKEIENAATYFEHNDDANSTTFIIEVDFLPWRQEEQTPDESLNNRYNDDYKKIITMLATEKAFIEAFWQETEFNKDYFLLGLKST